MRDVILSLAKMFELNKIHEARRSGLLNFGMQSLLPSGATDPGCRKTRDEMSDNLASCFNFI